ncbi:ceramide phosphoethanolamine synthase [Ooceraea biroi]|uniref:ceramide phosphoethanolamine synthase n=1 Tax=Ooceraea biroi TaxID=2015173 RepID=UPI000F075B79|nr:ceramide phosphoethanolamine synthase [Ooceraea biroi]
MLHSSTFISKISVAVLLLLLLYFVAMDCLLYFRIQNYDVRSPANKTPSSPYHSPISCDVNPICTVTVKAMMLDHPNQFILNPLAALVDRLLGISHSWTWVTPNAISISHVFVALIGARYITRKSLSDRRLGVVLFQVRTWMDDLDGHVARTRLNVKGERSDFGSIGYFVDGICDGLGCIALLVAVFIFLNRKVNRRSSYERLPTHASSSSIQSTTSAAPFWKSPLWSVLVMGLHFSLTSFGWNRYISMYQDLLEVDRSTLPISCEDLYDRQTVVFRSLSFWVITLAWKSFNFHAIMDYMLLAIFLDHIWAYVKLAWWQLPAILLLLIVVSEYHYTNVYTYVEMSSVKDNAVSFFIS